MDSPRLYYFCVVFPSIPLLTLDSSSFPRDVYVFGSWPRVAPRALVFLGATTSFFGTRNTPFAPISFFSFFWSPFDWMCLSSALVSRWGGNTADCILERIRRINSVSLATAQGRVQPLTNQRGGLDSPPVAPRSLGPSLRPPLAPAGLGWLGSPLHRRDGRDLGPRPRLLFLLFCVLLLRFLSFIRFFGASFACHSFLPALCAVTRFNC